MRAALVGAAARICAEQFWYWWAGLRMAWTRRRTNRILRRGFRRRRATVAVADYSRVGEAP
ncbi:MAG TPA: hypothetical protein VNJ11_17285 [Bryobacteraceae bacterium]|nr:hypothetical protein [Bryobacteraceae bacterium]